MTKFGRGDVEVKRGGAGDRSQRIVRRDADAGRFRRRGDLARFGETAGMGDVRLGDVQGMQPEQRLELGAADQALAGRDGHRGLRV